MNHRGVHLRYTFEDRGQHGAEVENPLFDLLSALQQQGSISRTAAAQGLSYRHVWGALKQWEAVLGAPLVVWAKGRHARLTPFAQRLLWAERQARTRLRPHVEALRSELARVFAIADDPGLEVLDIFASHDLGLPRLVALAETQRALHLGLRFTGSEEALRSLLDGRCLVAGFHVPRLAQRSEVFSQALRPLLKPGTHKLIGSHWRRQGLMLRPGAAAPAGVAELAGGRWRFVNRQPGSGTRLLMDHLLQQAALAPQDIPGYLTRVEQTHVAVAAAVASGAADVGLGIEAAAREGGLDFVPVADEDYYLVCLAPTLETPAVQGLRATLASPGWAQALQGLPGYGVHRPGEVLSLTRALPWWHFTRARRSRHPADAHA